MWLTCHTWPRHVNLTGKINYVQKGIDISQALLPQMQQHNMPADPALSVAATPMIWLRLPNCTCKPSLIASFMLLCTFQQVSPLWLTRFLFVTGHCKFCSKHRDGGGREGRVFWNPIVISLLILWTSLAHPHLSCRLQLRGHLPFSHSSTTATHLPTEQMTGEWLCI